MSASGWGFAHVLYVLGKLGLASLDARRHAVNKSHKLRILKPKPIRVNK